MKEQTTDREGRKRVVTAAAGYMNIGAADVLITDLTSVDEEQARAIFERMVEETRDGQVWAVILPTAFLDDVTLPDGLTTAFPADLPPLRPGVSVITGTVRKE